MLVKQIPDIYFLLHKKYSSYKELDGIPKKYENKIKEVGNIIREEIINLNLTNSEDKLENIKILVLGGSQAAQEYSQKSCHQYS